MKKFLVVFLVLFTGKVLAYTDVSAEEFKRLMKDKNVVILDVRTPQEYDKDGHIKGANLIPVQVFRYIYLPGLRDKKVLVYCRSGNRSVTASRILEQMGVKNVYNLKGGILEWKSKNFPVEYGWK
ncbi:Rhodanese-related sulfurtransferase [Persephonella hydrogeniphila]|uniref:Rhodanese-related sulfurtransferase n=1 Tax=Persephonella hydrogeniphila TaxID=198703 RepID=A0A285NBR6_9AQUI|nr:rhodanese-like domain-containing protein [Persephonella hydrogeniphila]SNZ06363.1 Rhodanese-related sulfurtransferase [Persephonella hydrogeniphila]